MLQHVDRPVRISTLCAVAGLSESYFFTLFKSVTGSAPMAFFIRLRIRRACELFQDQDLSVKETAALLGYQDQFYFSRTFKVVMGISPTEYRKKVRAVDEESRLRPSTA